MKKIISALFLSLAVISYAQDAKPASSEKKQSDKKAEKPAITWLKGVEINRPSIEYGADETFTFEFKNTGKTPILVSNVATSCGCTTAEKPNEPVAPGKTGKISVKYDTKRVGPFTKTITVTTNVGEPIVLTIKGTVNPEKQ